MALFGPSAVPANKNLIEFRAGQVNLNQNRAVPSKEKGLIYLKTGADHLVHFYWQNRENKVVLDDFTIIPGDAVFKNIEACTTGRVYALYITSSKSKQLYWMQEPSKDKDKDLVEKVNHILSNPAPTPETDRSHNMMEMLSSLRSSDLPGMFEGMDPNLIEQLMQSSSSSNTLRQFMNASLAGPSDPFSRGSASTGRSLFSSSGQSLGDGSVPSSQGGTGSSENDQIQETSGAGGTASRGVEGLDIQNLVSGLQLPESLLNQQTSVHFSEVITPQALESVLSDGDAVARLEALLPGSPEPLKDLLSSPQFAQALGFFSEGFASRQLAPLMHEYGPDAVVAAQEGDLVSLARAVERNLDEVVTSPVAEDTGQEIVDDSDELD
ncbi:Proteasomal ubiquitin receptor ADRM1 [Oopsacas minuta]|uniref:Proteasomal ubiquitin receptor ADRM1 n=1 Tax=Oopsacas minuta TaxID=111878 RepID=A0AAV7KBL1_9METZ|nr:Proteasomal ubiquitin receptor ADRM1 [Oopsacas minuta]